MSSVIVDAVRAGLRELSDVAFQRRVWTGQGGTDEMSSFQEAVSTLFDDSGLAPDLAHARRVFGSDVDAELRALRELVQRIDGFRSPAEIIEDPLMEAARKKAGAILEAIDGEARSPNT